MGLGLESAAGVVVGDIFPVNAARVVAGWGLLLRLLLWLLCLALRVGLAQHCFVAFELRGFHCQFCRHKVVERVVAAAGLLFGGLPFLLVENRQSCRDCRREDKSDCHKAAPFYQSKILFAIAEAQASMSNL